MNVISWNLFGGGAEHTKWRALAEYLDRNCVAIAALMEVKLLASELAVISGHFQHHDAHAQLPPPGAERSNGMLLLVHKALQDKVKVMECCEEKGDDKHWMQIMIRMRSSAPAPSAHSIHLVVVHGTPHRDKEVRLQMWSKFLCSVHRRRDDRAALLVMGDLNAALEDEGRQKACPVVREVLAELELTDLWRLRHPTQQHPSSFYRPHTSTTAAGETVVREQQSALDHACASIDADQFVLECEYDKLRSEIAIDHVPIRTPSRHTFRRR
jgi:exonuclease III